MAIFFPTFSLEQVVYQVNSLNSAKTSNQNVYYFEDSSAFQNHILISLKQDYKNGFLLAGIDSVYQLHDTFCFNYNQNKKFPGVFIQSVTSIFPKADPAKAILPEEWLKNSTELLASDLENGYPLSKIKLIQDSIIQDTLYAKLDYRRGPYIYFGEIDQRNGVVVNNQYLQELLHFKKGQAFHQKTVSRIGTIISRLPYIESQYRPRVNFFGEEADIYLYLKKKPANNFDLLLGFNNKQSGSSKSIQITGQANIDLYNSFKLGDRLYLHYENLQESSPRLNLLVDLPYVKLPFGVSTRFDLIKNKDQYINFQTQLKINKVIQQQEEMSLVLFNNSSYLLQIDTSFIKTKQELPKSLDFNFLSYGIAYKLNSTNDNFNPTKGCYLEVQGLIGTKRFSKNPSILKLDAFGKLNMKYDSLNRNGIQSNIHTNATFYFPLAKRQVIKLNGSGFILITQSQSLENELIKIGGIHSLRGFNDNQFSSDGYIISTGEYRFLLDKQSFLSLFADYAWMRLISQNTIIPWQGYLGIGAGMQFKTNAGAFGLFFAVGSTKSSSFDFSSPKVHFGYTTIF